MQKRSTVATMRCIFCKADSAAAIGVEHIIPQSLGNTNRMLPRGLVCDACNNYFARKVEGPLLAHPSFRNLRALCGIPNKKGRPPAFTGFIAGTELEVALRPSPGVLDIRAERKGDEEALAKHIAANPDEVFVIPIDLPGDASPPEYLMSRLLAKMALEFVSLRFLDDLDQFGRFLDGDYFERIRLWARRGEGFDGWPYCSRQIFPEHTIMRHPDTGAWVRAGYSMDVFMTKTPETYFALCLYGHEFVINVGGPGMKGYEEWLVRHKNISPLIERNGWRVVTDEPTAPGKVCLLGRSVQSAGVQFDRNQEGFTR